jgi:hypothetical protein
MQMTTFARQHVPNNTPSSPFAEYALKARPDVDFEKWMLDPLDPDSHNDKVVMTTDRRLVRLAIAASEAGARFEREGLDHDPAAWLLAPRQVFDGRAAVDACQDLEGFNRNIVLHGLHLDLDAEASHIDELLGDEDEPMDQKVTASVAIAIPSSLDGRIQATESSPDRCLWTCWLDLEQDGERIFTFWAVVSPRPEEIVERVVGRFGRGAAALATFRKGFDHSTPLGVSMISDAMADTLALAASDPTSPLADGLDILVEQRFKG